MSLDDGLVMQIHPGSFRNHNDALFRRFGRDMGADIPTPHRLRARAEAAARPLRQRAELHAHPLHARRDELLARAGAARRALSVPEARAAPGGSSTRRRACAASASSRRRPPASTTPSASTTTRAPICPFRRGTTWPAGSTAPISPNLVTTHRLDEDEAHEVAHDLAYRLAKEAYKL